MAQQNINLGTPGNSSTGDFVYDAFAKVQANFDDLYSNYLAKAGGSMMGTINMNWPINSSATITNVAGVYPYANNTGSIGGFGSAFNVIGSTNFAIQSTSIANLNWRVRANIAGGDLNIEAETGVDTNLFNTVYTLNYSGTPTLTTDLVDKAYVDALGAPAAGDVTFSSYLTITSANVQAAIQELKDEVDALALSSGSGDMLKSTYDTDNDGVVDNSELLQGQNSAYHLSRTNHTGTQLASTISDFDTEVSNNASVVANTAKVTNATHTGEVTGSTTLTLNATAISNRALATMVAGDQIVFLDATDGLLKRGNVVDLITGSLTVDTIITDGSTNPVTNNAIHDALVNINNWVATNNIESNKIADGAGSGLDADLLDGVQGSSYARTDTSESFNGPVTFTSTLTSTNSGGLISANPTNTLANVSLSWLGDAPRLRIGGSGTGSAGTFSIQGTGDFVRMSVTSAGNGAFAGTSLTVGGNTVWHQGNDGNGSGLDADLLRGYIPATTATTNTVAVRTSSGMIQVIDQAYDATTWNGSLEVPTKNAIRDKFESLFTGYQSGATTRSSIRSGQISSAGTVYVSYVYDPRSLTCTYAIRFSGITANYTGAGQSGYVVSSSVPYAPVSGLTTALTVAQSDVSVIDNANVQAYIDSSGAVWIHMYSVSAFSLSSRDMYVSGTIITGYP